MKLYKKLMYRGWYSLLGGHGKYKKQGNRRIRRILKEFFRKDQQV